MLWDLLDEKEKARVMIKILLYLAKADGKVSEHEFTYLVHVSNKLHIDLEEMRELFLAEDELREILPADEQDRMNVLYHLLFIMDADKKISDEEENVLYHFGHKLGFSEWMVRDYIEVFKKYDIDDLPPEAMLNIIKKYQN
jgi:uncharacterized tellurite resistance protein B-like protein